MSQSAVEDRVATKGIPYQALVGELLYLAVAMRLGIPYAGGVPCRLAESDLAHWQAGQRISLCLRCTTHLLLVHSASFSPIHRFTTYSDADLGGNPDNSSSTGGLAFTLTGYCLASCLDT